MRTPLSISRRRQDPTPGNGPTSIKKTPRKAKPSHSDIYRGTHENSTVPCQQLVIQSSQICAMFEQTDDVLRNWMNMVVADSWTLMNNIQMMQIDPAEFGAELQQFNARIATEIHIHFFWWIQTETLLLCWFHRHLNAFSCSNALIYKCYIGILNRNIKNVKAESSPNPILLHIGHLWKLVVSLLNIYWPYSDDRVAPSHGQATGSSNISLLFCLFKVKKTMKHEVEIPIWHRPRIVERK